MLRISIESKYDFSTQKNLTRLLGEDRVKTIKVSRVFWLTSEKPLAQYPLEKIFYDPISEKMSLEYPPFEAGKIYAEIRFQNGVTDNLARSATEALMLFAGPQNKSWQDFEVKVHSGWQLVIESKENISKDEISQKLFESLANPLLNTISLKTGEELFQNNVWKNYSSYWNKNQMVEPELQLFDLKFETLMKLNLDRGLALSENEIQTLIHEFSKPDVAAERSSRGWKNKITEVELECFAQTWSEHCKHKIFAAEIDYTEDLAHSSQPQLGAKKVKSLYKSYIQKVTQELHEDMLKTKNKSYLVSVFKDNAGIVDFDSKVNLCIKVETHNSPSALDPFGGALTGILGVNRDILGCGLSAKPIANTNVFCLSTKDLFPSHGDGHRPEKLKDPGIIFRGVHAGVEEGGNQSGIPTLNGAFHFASEFSAKPLIFVGSVGVMPKKINHRNTEEKKIYPGDLIIVAGGRLGKDGVHGATFSSLALADNMSSGVVQIGDSITQKRVLDFTLKARDLNLIQAITDNGAGGVSSSIGEMATLSGGARMDLAQHPLKYQGLNYWEMLVSESQERMSYAVRPVNKNKFLDLAQQYGVEAFVMGEFTDSGFFDIRYNEKSLAYLDLHFLHNGLEKMKLKAHYTGPIEYKEYHRTTSALKVPAKKSQSVSDVLLKVLASANVASKEPLVRYYDHEVQAATRLKPYSGKTQQGASDSGVIDLSVHGGEKNNAAAVACGLNPQISYYDAYLMAQRAVDEAIRNLVATGVDPAQIVLVDNFCWPDPLESKTNPDAQYKLAQLVRACAGLYEAAKIYKAPLVSGKDSMKNDFIGLTQDKQTVKISVPPTLLMTALGRIPQADKTVSGYFKNTGDLIYVIGDLTEDLYGSSYLNEYTDTTASKIPVIYPDLEKNQQLYSDVFNLIQKDYLKSCHDISDGGLLSAVSESCFGNYLGAEINLEKLNWNQLWSEAGSKFIVSIAAKDQTAFENSFKGAFQQLGRVTDSPKLQWTFENEKSEVSLDQLNQSWSQGVVKIYES